MRLSELAAYLNTDIATVVRDCEVYSAELCSDVKGPSAITYLEKSKFLEELEKPGIAAVICTEKMLPLIPSSVAGVLLSDAPKFAFYNVHNFFARQRQIIQIPTKIGNGSVIAPGAIVAPYNVQIGNRVVIEPGAIVREFVTIGDDTHIYEGAVIGAKSFNPARYKDCAITMEDCGSVWIGNHVEICSQSTVARGVLDSEETRVGSFSKYDTLVHVGHGAQIGERTFVASGSILSGNCKLGEDVWVGVNATVCNRIRIGDRARISLGAVVTKDVPAGETVSGNFAINHCRFLQNLKESLAEDTDSGEMPPSPGEP